ICIGSGTLLSNAILLALSQNNKSFGVLCFVFIAGTISSLLGIGLLKFRKEAYSLLLYFSSMIILSKALIFLGVIHLNGALGTLVPGPVKDIVSIIYHGLVIVYLNKPDVKQIFHQ
ncbi:MAG TPA: hypothetical protein PKV41_02650, partial [Candidatus Omnitrophota bacterium]|nr:hypothetical protein [Candidatus Omnitrophota bacterium]